MRYNKLVRDKIPEHIESKGGRPIFHVADEEEYRIKLGDKLLEEAKEFLDSGSVEEVSDILEVVDAICEFYGFSKVDVYKIKIKKLEERGGFKKRIVLDES